MNPQWKPDVKISRMSPLGTPMTGRELAKVRKKIDRQTRGLVPQVPDPGSREEEEG